MKRKWEIKEENYFGIGVYQPKTWENIGILWRTAYIYKASFIFVIGARYKKPSSDVLKVWAKIPLFQYTTLESFLDCVPYSCQIVGIEMNNKSFPIKEYLHPNRAIYILGSEDNGLPNALIKKCHDLIYLPGDTSLNVAVAGSITIFDRVNKLKD